MGTVHNSETINEMVKAAGIQTANELPTRTLSNQIVPVMEVNPKLTRITDFARTATLTNGTSTTLITAPALATKQKLFITGANLSYIKDATATSTGMVVQSTVDSQTINLVQCVGLTLTAANGAMSQTFNPPLQIDPGATITIASSTGTANVSVRGSIFGFYTRE